MTENDKLEYNKNKAQKYGWTPEWFGCNSFDADLLSAIISFQKKYGLSADGLCGSSTFRRLWTEREAEQENHQIQMQNEDKNYIIQGQWRSFGIR